MTPGPQRPALEQQLAFWKRQIAQSGGACELPTDDVRPPVSSFFRELTALRMSAERRAALSKLTTDTGSSELLIAIAAVALVVGRLAERSEVWLGTAVLGYGGAGREALNPLALRLAVSQQQTVRAFVDQVREVVSTALENRDVPIDTVEALADGQPLFRVLVLPAGVRVVPTEAPESAAVDQLGARAAGCDLILRVVAADDGLELQASYDPELFRPTTIERTLNRVDAVVAGMAADETALVSTLTMVSEAERQFLVHEWNSTDVTYDRDSCVHQLIERQAERTPDHVALVYADRKMTYSELNERANELARLLVAKGVGPDVPVGVCTERSHQMVIAVLAVHKAAGAYIPMDPHYPSERLAYMVEDSGLKLILADAVVPDVVSRTAEVVRVDRLSEVLPSHRNHQHHLPSSSLAYITYTSGSTGTPKGVMVEHRNVVSFFAGMDQRLGTRAGVWLAVTSLSFDISVLELLWTLSHGYTVVLYSSSMQFGGTHTNGDELHQPLKFGLFYFGSDEGTVADLGGQEKYKLLLEGARFADEHGFCAVWTPERHFHTFGGLFPSPSVAAGALAIVTTRVNIRAGSVVLPLHNPVRVTEEWSLVDNLSNGRVSISFASGWQPQDFVIAPEAYANRHALMFEGIETVRALWRGETREGIGGDGKPVTFTTRPRPVQSELPVWVTAGGSAETFRRAGEIGANVLTHLLQQSIEQLRERIEIYRAARKESGYEGDGHVALMLHTFVSHDERFVRATVHAPFRNYLKGAVGLFAAVAPPGTGIETASSVDRETLAEHAFTRYFESGGLFGTPDTCMPLIHRLRQAGVTELACLIDFGIPAETVLASLPVLDDLRRRCATAATATSAHSVVALLSSHRVTHFQCTPSMARVLMDDPETARALATLEHMLVGGEALSESLATRLKRALPNVTLTNMYGPTETTVWSMAYEVDSEPDGPVPIGRPLANTQVYVLDSALDAVPFGAAGEIYIGGDGVARGYFNRPDLTRQRFIDDPFRPGQRLYRTGDLARHRSDGTLDFLGRSDHQVKLRGYRIELEEIERCLNQHPDVAQAVVTTEGSVDADARLIAYVATARVGSTVDVADLRQSLRRRLPDYMVPTDFVVLDRLPLTPNGKLDRRALKAPVDTKKVQQAPQLLETATEKVLADVWKEVLRVDRVGRDDNFFEWGGHSLLAMQLARKIRERFGVDYPLQSVFLHARFGAMAADIDGVRAVVVADAELATGALVAGFDYGEL